MEKIKEWIPYIVILVVIILLKTFVFTTIRVDGNSMFDTLKDKDIMILNKIGYRFSDIKRFDIVVVNTKENKIIKRVIGLPGETVEYVDNILYINGEEVKDVHNHIEQEDFLVKLGKEEYFVMGDNRGDSFDSRRIGPVKKEDIMGHATFILFPFGRFGSVE